MVTTYSVEGKKAQEIIIVVSVDIYWISEVWLQLKDCNHPCRFRMSKSLFLRIVNDLTARNKYFKQKRNAAWKQGFHPIHKCLVAMRMLAYGGPADALDDTYKMAESTVLETLMEFVTTVIDVYGGEYLRPPNPRELEVILRHNEARGFPGMIGSIDCMHWEWENCPTGWSGMCKLIFSFSSSHLFSISSRCNAIIFC